MHFRRLRRLRWAVILSAVVLFVALAFRAGLDLAPRAGIVSVALADAMLPALPIPAVVDISPTGDLVQVVAWYRAHEDDVREIFRDDVRAGALFAMYTVHIAVPYGTAPAVTSLAEFVEASRAHCGTYRVAQQAITNALGYRTRQVAFADGSHGWLEVNIGGAWEIFDSTINVWISVPMNEMLSGADRAYRPFYTPVFDSAAPDTFRMHIGEGWSVAGLRRLMPEFGRAVDAPAGLITL